jgi:hypothetical protein
MPASTGRGWKIEAESLDSELHSARPVPDETVTETLSGRERPGQYGGRDEQQSAGCHVNRETGVNLVHFMAWYCREVHERLYRIGGGPRPKKAGWALD